MIEDRIASEEKESIGWAASPMRELTRLAWPIAISMVSYALMTLVDTLFVGRLGPSALAGVGLGGTAAFSVIVFSFGLLRGVKVLVSQAVGAGQTTQAKDYVGAGLAFAAMLGVLSLALGLVIAHALPFVAATAASGEAAFEYTAIRMLGTPLVLGYVALREARYGFGDAQGPMVAVLVANLLNIALDYLFLVELEWGVAGAAWATVISNVVTFVIMLSRQLRDGFGQLRVAHLRSIWRVGLPVGAQFLMEFGAFGIMAVLLAALNENEMAAHQIALQVIHFTFLPAVAVGEAGSVMAGQLVGARRDDLVLGIAHRVLLVTGAYAFLCTVILVGFATPIASQFTSDWSLLQKTTHLLWVAAAFQLADAAQIAARSVLRGVGDVTYPAIVGITTAWICTPPLTWLLGYHMGLGALGGWLGLCTEIVVGAFLFWWRLQRGGWLVAAAKTRLELEAGEADLALVA